MGELPLALQAKLLNVLERRQVRRLGSTREHSVNAHVVAATNRDLNKMVAEGRFRSDLYFRLNVLGLALPPLRDRKEDISLLAEHFVQAVSRRYGLQPPVFSDAASVLMENYHWPGNVRELQHVVERAVMLSQEGQILPEQLMLQSQPMQPASAQGEELGQLGSMTLEQVEKLLLEKALQRSGGNVSRAARELGLTRMAMRYRMEKYQL